MLNKVGEANAKFEQEDEKKPCSSLFLCKIFHYLLIRAFLT